MGQNCRAGQYWDFLIKQCVCCSSACKQSHVNARCISYCESASCKALPGYYYDELLKTCVRCAEVCGRHPAECSQHCMASPPPVTTKKLLVKATTQVPNCRGLSVPAALEDSTVLLYSLLAVCLLLLFSSLSLALAVFLRGARTKASNPGPKQANHSQKRVVQPGQEVGQPGQSSKDFVTNSSRLTDREPSEDSSPTETCVCVHCFPDLKALGHGNDRLPTAPFSIYPQPVLHRAQIQKEGPFWAEGDLHTSRLQEEANVG